MLDGVADNRPPISFRATFVAIVKDNIQPVSTAHAIPNQTP